MDKLGDGIYLSPISATPFVCFVYLYLCLCLKLYFYSYIWCGVHVIVTESVIRRLTTVFFRQYWENKRKTDFDQNNIKHCQILPHMSNIANIEQILPNIKHCQSDIKTLLPGEISPLVVIIISNINIQQCNCAGLERFCFLGVGLKPYKDEDSDVEVNDDDVVHNGAVRHLSIPPQL